MALIGLSKELQVLEDSEKRFDAFVLKDSSREIRGQSEDPFSVRVLGPTFLIDVGAERQQDVDDDDRIRPLLKFVNLNLNGFCVVLKSELHC